MRQKQYTSDEMKEECRKFISDEPRVSQMCRDAVRSFLNRHEGRDISPDEIARCVIFIECSINNHTHVKGKNDAS